jgi:hypothetical protein
MPRFALRVAWCAAATGLVSIAGCSLDMNGTGVPLGDVADGPEGSSGGPDGTTGTMEGSVAPDAGDTSLSDATLPDGALRDGAAPDASGHDASVPDGTPPDVIVVAGNDGSADAPTCATATNGGTCVVVPPGWSIVAFAGDRTQPCPADFSGGPNDVVEAPNAANACSCGACAVTSQPSCDQGTIGATYGTSTGGGFGGFGGSGGGTATCTTAGTALALDPGGDCLPYPSPSGQGPNAFDAVEYTPPAPAGGSCSSQGVGDPSQITYGAEERLCTAGASVTQACSTGQPCSAGVDGDYRVCIMMPGAPVGCPAGSPFSTPHWVGGPANLACSDCGCAIGADTCSGTLNTFRDNTCQTMDTTFRVDGSCQSSFSAMNATSYTFVADAMNASCSATGTSSATNVALTSPATICCAQ